MNGSYQSTVIISQNHKKWLLSFLLLFSTVLHAKFETYDGLVHIHLGLVNGSYSGPVQTQFSVPQGINFEYEFIKDSKSSRYIRSLMAFDSAQGRLVYFLNAFGSRYYFNSNSSTYNLSKDGETYQLLPKKRYFYGWDAGISQVVVETLGKVLQATSTNFDIGGHIGMSYHIKPTWALEVVFGYSYAYGFSSVAVTGTTMRLMFGGSYYY